MSRSRRSVARQVATRRCKVRSRPVRIPLGIPSLQVFQQRRPLAIATGRLAASPPTGHRVCRQAAIVSDVTQELDPAYCDVICRRFEAYTGKPAILANWAFLGPKLPIFGSKRRLPRQCHEWHDEKHHAGKTRFLAALRGTDRAR